MQPHEVPIVSRGQRRHFSMLRDFRIADLFTLLNGFAGTGAILCFMRFCIDGRIGFFWAGAGLLPFALLMDVLDGRVARARGESSLLGQELDSLADVVSFGVAPATMAFSAGLRGEWDCVCLMFFVACGISRLARYNVTAPAMSAKTSSVPALRCPWLRHDQQDVAPAEALTFPRFAPFGGRSCCRRLQWSRERRARTYNTLTSFRGDLEGCRKQQRR
jgi:CDP-diacylglycerol--serine O-phosphatidyltransferase